MLPLLKLYAACFAIFVVVDFLWIALLMKNFYVEQLRPIGRIVGDKFSPVLWAAVAVYVVLAIGVVQFALPKIAAGESFLSAFAVGALLGFVVYATYDFTNYSTLKDYTIAMVCVDIAWGSFVTGLVTAVAHSYIR